MTKKRSVTTRQTFRVSTLQFKDDHLQEIIAMALDISVLCEFWHLTSWLKANLQISLTSCHLKTDP